MNVQAVKMGYYNHKRRREGENFQLLDKEDFSTKWMKKLDADVVVPADKPVESRGPKPLKTKHSAIE